MKLKIETRRFGIQTVLIDDEDYDLIKGYNLRVIVEHGKFYARCYHSTNGKRKEYRMHRVIMGLRDSQTPSIDHKNRNPLDNRKSNLRVATTAQNSSNIGLTKRNSTGYKGATVVKTKCGTIRYRAVLKSNGETYQGGFFRTAIEAANKYNEMALKHHGEFAFINTIDPVELKTEQDKTEQLKKVKYPKKRPLPISGYWGVSIRSGKYRKKKYAAQLLNNQLGTFYTSKEAALAYDAEAKKIFKEYAILNFPDKK